jgi:hypothetical protein
VLPALGDADCDVPGYATDLGDGTVVGAKIADPLRLIAHAAGRPTTRLRDLQYG